MIRIVGQRAHVGRTNVEEVVGISGVIGEAAPNLGSLFDQGDSENRLGVLQQLVGEQDARGTPANDDRVSFREGEHAQTPSSLRSGETRDTRILARKFNSCRK